MHSRYPNERRKVEKKKCSHRSAAGVRIHSEAREKRKRWNSACGMPKTICCVYGRHFNSANWSMDQMETASTTRPHRLLVHENYISIELFRSDKEEINNLTILTHLRNGRSGISKLLCTIYLRRDRQAARRRQIVFTLAANIRCINLHTRNERRGQTKKAL